MKVSYIIGICGNSCSGKTTVCEEIIKKILESSTGSLADNISVISQDNYYFGGNNNTNYDIPESIDFNKLIEDVKRLINGEEIDIPIYDFSTHSRKKELMHIKPARIIIIEGILIFSQYELRNLCNLKVFVSAYPELRYSRRLKRDVTERNRDEQEVIDRYFRDVLPASRHYVDPTIEFSDIALMNNTHNQFIGLQILLDHIEKKIKELA